MSKSYWKSGESRSIRLTDRISSSAYEALNSKDMMIRNNRNRFITRAINNQVILEYGTVEEKLKLLGIEDLRKLIFDINISSEVENQLVKDDELSNYKIVNKDESKVSDLISSLPTI